MIILLCICVKKNYYICLRVHLNDTELDQWVGCAGMCCLFYFFNLPLEEAQVQMFLFIFFFPQDSTVNNTLVYSNFIEMLGLGVLT